VISCWQNDSVESKMDEVSSFWHRDNIISI
jgi:hypothetical protein